MRERKRQTKKRVGVSKQPMQHIAAGVPPPWSRRRHRRRTLIAPLAQRSCGRLPRTPTARKRKGDQNHTAGQAHTHNTHTQHTHNTHTHTHTHHTTPRHTTPRHTTPNHTKPQQSPYAGGRETRSGLWQRKSRGTTTTTKKMTFPSYNGHCRLTKGHGAGAGTNESCESTISQPVHSAHQPRPTRAGSRGGGRSREGRRERRSHVRHCSCCWVSHHKQRLAIARGGLVWSARKKKKKIASRVGQVKQPSWDKCPLFHTVPKSSKTSPLRLGKVPDNGEINNGRQRARQYRAQTKQKKIKKRREKPER